MVIATPAAAGFNDGNSFLRSCDGNTDRMYCVGYVSGLVDALDFNICVPDGVTPEQIAETIIATLRDRPEIRHGNMGHILRIALKERPLCQSE